MRSSLMYNPLYESQDGCLLHEFLYTDQGQESTTWMTASFKTLSIAKMTRHSCAAKRSSVLGTAGACGL